MEKIRFITDSASDMNHSREDVTILPLHIRFGDDEYADGVTISHREFYEKLIECDTLPTTSLVSPAVFEDAYEQAVSAGETVIVITISGKLSGTCQSARIAAEDYEGKVFVVDSMNATIGERILVEYGLQLKDQGKSAEEIVSILEKEKSTRTANRIFHFCWKSATENFSMKTSSQPKNFPNSWTNSRNG